jgi:AhpD family alkylhydroperoxidase
MNLDERTLRLIAVGASIAANCQPCLQTNVTQARDSGAGEPEIAEAIRVGRMVRHGAASVMDRFVSSLSSDAPHSERLTNVECGCS